MANKPFLTDIQTLRERARQHIENGAVTQGYTADRETVVKLLNDPESFVQPYAAAALVLMRADAYYKDAMPHLENRNSLTGYLIGSKLSAAPEPMVETIKKRAIDAWEEARRATGK